MMNKKFAKLSLTILSVLALSLAFTGIALAFPSGDNPADHPGDNTVQWTGQGASNGQVGTELCDAGNTPDGQPNTAYLFWKFTTDGGSAHDVTLHLGGTGSGDYPADTATGSSFGFFTPYFTPDNSLTAYVDFTVDTTGRGGWNLVISHGCAGGGAEDLTVSKTANVSFTRTFEWTIDKSADTDRVYSAGGGESGAVNFTVAVTKSDPIDSDFLVSGTITVHNPNSFAVNDVSLSDSTPDGDCTVTPDSVDVPAGDDATADYECTFTSNPGSGTNTATATWTDFGSPNTSASGTKDYTFSDPTNVVNDEIDVTDSNGQSWHFTDSGSKTYSITYTDPAGTCTDHTNTATITQTGDSDSVTVKDCQGADLTVEKTATPTFTRTFHWTIDKSANPTTVYSAGGGASNPTTFTIAVTKDDGTDSDFIVSGTITVSNPNDWQNITLTSLDDVIDVGGNCTVDTSAGLTIPMSDSNDYPYECTFDSNPGSGTNTATANWDAAAAHTSNGSASGTADFAFGDPTTVVNDEIDVTDTNGGSWHFTDWGSVSYDKTYTDEAGTCTSHENTASIDQTGQSDSATVKDCQGADLTVTKTATPSFDLKYAWTIDKAIVGSDSATVDQGQPATFNYTITVSHDAGTQSNWKVSGTITVSNPNNWEDIVADVSDSIPGGTCSVSGGTQVTVPMSDSVTLNYSCSFGSNPGSGTNTATATWDATAAYTPHGSASGGANFDFANATVNAIDECVTVVDDKATPGNTSDDVTLGTVCVGDPSPKVFNYSLTFTGPAAGTCADFTNTSTFTTNDSETQGSDSATVHVCSFGPRFTPGYWKTHLAPTGSPGCTGLPSGTGCSSNGPWAMNDKTKMLGNYGPIDTQKKAADVFAAMNCSNTGSTATQNQNAIGCLAGHLLAAKYNRNINNSNSCIDPVIALADQFLKNPPPTTVTFGAYSATSINYVGPSGSYTGISTTQRNLAIALKTALDQYNNGGYCH